MGKCQETLGDRAVKIIDKAGLSEDQIIYRRAKVNREAFFMQEICHPNALLFYGAYEDSKAFYLVLELL